MKSFFGAGILSVTMGETVKKRLGEILIEDGILSPENLEEALNQQKKEGGIIGQILIRLGYISEEDLVAAVAKQIKVPYLPLANYSINTDAAKLLTKEFCVRNQIVLFDQTDKNIFIAMGDPLNEGAVDEIQKKLNLNPQIFISTPTEVLSMLDILFAGSNLKKAG